MRHMSKSRRFGRDTEHRESMFRNMVTSLFVHERILTTVERAKELRRIAERLITLGKRGDLAARRLAASRLKVEGKNVGKQRIHEAVALKKLFDTIAPRFKDRPGGYTRIVRTSHRVGDNAAMAYIELLPSPEQAKASGEGAKKGAAAAKKPAATKKTAAKASTPKKAAPVGAKKATPKKAAEAKPRAKSAKSKSAKEETSKD